MNFDWKNIDLKNASIFDLTDDLELIKKCILNNRFTWGDKEKYLKNLDNKNRYQSILDFSSFTSDDKLYNLVCKTFPKEHEENLAIFDE